ncbi:uncharacterized protein I206_107200 [Kwoniella pini CBS 10737]|uniref:25S rRNA adenine-N(1) methyltransferase n=1 Tax=Kwoniella pini CBS 10737 TaxID=1296096 RepID=A0A1B9HYX8_9TREE|nr:uncharacterized protein I206_05255 [Kwoniella pini CBS 10737]OCF48476.1 hypothetical protein I206_05255 [Kwoniella pini CBS 10737]
MGGNKARRLRKLPISASAFDDRAGFSTSKSSSADAPSHTGSDFRSRKKGSQRSVVSRKVTQSTISRFHTLLKRQAVLKRILKSASTKNESVVTIEEELASIAQEIDALGGLTAYQVASTLGQSSERGGDSSKVLVKWLEEIGLKQQAISEATKLHMLEIGALVPTNFASCSRWIQNNPIDLHSQHPNILEQDFFDRPLPSKEEEAFDIVSCSLVLNFVSSPVERGKKNAATHPQTAEDGFYFGSAVPGVASTLSDKLTLFIPDVASCASQEANSDKWRKKAVLEDGPKKNNFAILLP